MSNILQNVAHLVINNGQCQLIDAEYHAIKWFDNNKTGILADDLLLAKSMGIILSKNPENLLESIAASDKNIFYINSIDNFVKIIESIKGKICIIVDRSKQSFQWIKDFVEIAKKSSIDRGAIKVCFRESNDTNSEFNQWIKNNDLGGPVDSGKIYIFSDRPAKWIFTKDVDIKIVATTMSQYPSDQIIKNWYLSQPCMIYLGSSKLLFVSEDQIVKL
jgi:hypothetical protein